MNPYEAPQSEEPLPKQPNPESTRMRGVKESDGGRAVSSWSERSVRVVASVFLIVGCTRSNGPNEPSIRADDAAAPLVEIGTPTAETSTDTGTETEEGSIGESCAIDADCGWDDPCFAKACLRVTTKTFVGCDKSMPPPGTCSCVDHRCTLVPTKSAPTASGGAGATAI